MSVFDTIKNKSICVYPWVHEFKTIEGGVGPCCHGDNLRDNESIETVRQEMLEGTQPRACEACYIKEKDSGWSPRIHETRDWVNKFGEPDINKPKLEFIDVRFDPTCNLKCKTCGPHDSTLWQKEKGVKITANRNNEEYINSVDKKILKKVYLAGGEPTYIRSYQGFLQELLVVNPNCEVIINTNLKKLPDVWKKIITDFKNLTVDCSCDAIETLGTYVRYPLGWKEFEDNVKFVSEHANFLHFNLVASNITSHKLYETCTWMKKYSNNINLTMLNSPFYFSEKAVPLEYREAYINNLKKLSKFPLSVRYAVNFRSKIQYLIKKYSESQFDESLLLKLREEITEQDSHRTLKLCDVDPFLYQWIYG